MFLTHEEENLINDGLKKYANNPTDFILNNEERQAASCWLARERMNGCQQSKNNSEKTSTALKSQIFYVQKKIRRHELKLKTAILCGHSDFEKALQLCGLRIALVTPNTVLTCLSELHVERCIRGMLGYTEFEIPIEQQADALKLELIEPNRERGKYIGNIVGIDHLAGLVQFSSKKLVALPFIELAHDQIRPSLGDTVALTFKHGILMVRA